MEYHRREPQLISDHELREYVLNLLREKRYCRDTMVTILSVLRNFYRLVFHRTLQELEDVLPIMKSPMRLPRIYSRDEIQRLLSVDGLSHRSRTMLITTYATGVRVGELCRLKISDILTSRMQVFVEQGKGHRDRYTVLSPKLLKILRTYWQVYRPTKWLFENLKNPDKSVHPTCAQRAFSIAVKTAGLPNHGIHALRHSFATHMYESGVDLATLQVVLGHKSLLSTAVYIHVARPAITLMQSPLDSIEIGAEATSSIQNLSQPTEVAPLAHWWIRRENPDSRSRSHLTSPGGGP